MTALFLFVSMAMAVLAPQRDHTDLANAIVSVVESEAPLFSSDASKYKTAALLIAVAYRESSFRNDAVGDHGRSVCAYQIHGGSPELRDDPEACVRTAFAMLRESVRMDPNAPVAFYARGPRYRSEEARRISRDRMWLARQIAGER